MLFNKADGLDKEDASSPSMKLKDFNNSIITKFADPKLSDK